MAADCREYKHNTDLFIKDGKPITFFLRPCHDKLLIKPYIEHGGGKILSKYVTGAIKLAQDSDYMSSDGYISTKYILECARQNKLLNTDLYAVKRQRNKKMVDNAEELSDVSDDLSPSSSILMEARDIKGRSKYTVEEDIKMLKFIVEEERQSAVHGMQLFKDMEILKITNHTASSMNTRMRKIILPNIRQYDIPNKWMKMFTSGTSPENTKTQDKVKRSPKKPLFSTQNAVDKKQVHGSNQCSDDEDIEIDSFVSEDEFDKKLKNIGDDSAKSKLPVNSTPTLKRKKPHSATEVRESRMTYVMEEDDNEDIIPDDTDDVNSDVEPIQETLNKLGEMFGLLDEEVLYLLTRHDGSVKETMRYIETGKSNLTWDLADDKDLMNNKNMDKLNKKYSEARVRSRAAFLEGV